MNKISGSGTVVEQKALEETIKAFRGAGDGGGPVKRPKAPRAGELEGRREG